MSTYDFTPVQRYAIWSHHGKVCRWCGEPVRLLDTEVDHVVPEHLLNKPDVLSAFLHECGIDQSFLVNDYGNWIPCHSSCNRIKGGKLPPRVPLVVALLEELRECAPKVRATVERLIKSRATDALLGKVMAAVQGGTISADELRTIADAASDDADVSAITEQFCISKENWSLLARVERAALAQFYASIDIVAMRDPATFLWSPTFARADLAHHIEPSRSSDVEDLGSVRVLRERLPGNEFFSRMRRALLGEPFYCAGVGLAEHGLDRPWTTELHNADHGVYSDWPCVHGLSAQFPHEIPRGELLCGPPEGQVYEDVYSLVARLLRVHEHNLVNDLRHRNDRRGRGFNLIVHDPRGRILVEETPQGICVRAEVTVEARLAAIFKTRDQDKTASINCEVPRGGVTRDVPGRFVAGKLKLWSRTDEPIDECSWSSSLRADSPPLASGGEQYAGTWPWPPESPDYG